jgi:two-component system, LuxR family, sensor kinase FixL
MSKVLRTLQPRAASNPTREMPAGQTAEETLHELYESLQQREEFLHTIGNKLPQAMFFQVVHEPDGSYRFTYVSEGVEEVTGLSAERLFEDPNALTELLVEEDQPRFWAAITTSLKSCSPLDEVCRMKWSDGSTHWCHFRSGVRPLADGAVACEGIVLDITAQKCAEEALAESRARNQAILLALPDIMFLLSTDGTYLDVHPRDRKDLLLPPERFIGRKVSEVMPPDLGQQIMNGFARVMAEGGQVLEYSLPMAGERRYYEARMVRCGTEEILVIVRDVTESKRAQLEVQRSHLELAHVSRVTSLGEITASLAHELNQPLTVILSNAQAAQRSLASNKLHEVDMNELLEDIVQADKRAGDVIRRMRSWLGRDQPLRQALALNDVIKDVEHMIRSELILRHVRLNLELADELPDVSADRVLLQQVVLNLVFNAIEAMQHQPAVERQLVIRTIVTGHEVLTSVRDYGTGIRPEHMNRLFDAFFSTKSGGLGIGLRICASIVRGHEGRIWAANNNDAGATIFFTLPVVEQNP